MAHSTFPAAFQTIVNDFQHIDDWEERYRYLVELGVALPKLAWDEKIDTNKVRGCVSQVWLVPGEDRQGGLARITFRGESDAMIVQGLLAILLALYSGRTASEIVETDATAVFDELGMREHLTTQRANGLTAMIHRIRAEGIRRSAQI